MLYPSRLITRTQLGRFCKIWWLSISELDSSKVSIFGALTLEKTQIGQDLPPFLPRILCGTLLFVDDLASVCFQEHLCISFSRCSSLYIRLFTYAFFCSLKLSSRRILPILAFFRTFLRVFLDSLYTFYFLLSLVALPLSFQFLQVEKF